MRNECKRIQRDLSRWVDGELKGGKADGLHRHVGVCAFCQSRLKAFSSLAQILRSEKEPMQVSAGFETVFWKKALERQGVPWFARLLEGLNAWIPVPNMAQAVAVVLVAVLIGGTSGAVSAMNEPPPAQSPAHFISGFSEYKGLPNTSVSAVYLKMSDRGSQE